MKKKIIQWFLSERNALMIKKSFSLVFKITKKSVNFLSLFWNVQNVLNREPFGFINFESKLLKIKLYLKWQLIIEWKNKKKWSTFWNK